MQVGTGKSILNGIAIGKLKIYKKKDTVISTAQVADTAAEEARFEEARAKAIDQQTALYEKALAEAGEDIAEVFNIHAMMLDDDDFVDAIKEILPETLMMGSVAMIDAPEAASTTGGGAGQYVRLWVIFCVLGLAAGAGLAVLEFFLRPTLLNVKDVEDVLKLETLGSIPKDNSYFQKNMQLLSETHLSLIHI